MKNINNVIVSCTLILLFSLLNACGGGGGGASSSPVALKFRTYSASTAQLLGEAQFRVMLPKGVSVATTAGNPKVVAPGVLFSRYSAGTTLMGSYSTAKPAGSGSDAIRVIMSLAAGKTFPVGEFLTVNCTAAPGSVAAKSNFTLSEVILGGAFGVDLTSQYKLDFKVQ